MANILVICERADPAYIETNKLLEIASKRYPLHPRCKLSANVNSHDLAWCDIVLSIRSTSSLEWHLARYLKHNDKFWILEPDDDFIGMDSDYGKDGEGYWSGRSNAMRRMLDYADLILTGNCHIAQKYTSIGNVKRHCLIDTLVDQDQLTKPRMAGLVTKIVIYVNDGTTGIFNQIIKPVMPLLCEKYSGKVSLTLMSLHPDISEYEDKIEVRYVPHQTFRQFREYIANEHFDIGLAPLYDSGFGKFKYYNKYIEYTIAGIAGIYSDCELYSKPIRNGYNGLLCKNTPEAWMEAISKLTENPTMKLQIANEAQNDIRKNFSETAIIDKLIMDVPELTNYKAPASKYYPRLLYIKVCYYLFRVGGWIHTGTWYLRNRGVKGFILRLKRKILDN